MQQVWIKDRGGNVLAREGVEEVGWGTLRRMKRNEREVGEE